MKTMEEKVAFLNKALERAKEDNYEQNVVKDVKEQHVLQFKDAQKKLNEASEILIGLQKTQLQGDDAYLTLLRRSIKQVVTQITGIENYLNDCRINYKEEQ